MDNFIDYIEEKYGVEVPKAREGTYEVIVNDKKSNRQLSILMENESAQSVTFGPYVFDEGRPGRDDIEEIAKSILLGNYSYKKKLFRRGKYWLKVPTSRFKAYANACVIGQPVPDKDLQSHHFPQAKL
jgi:hypothetical protein